MKWVSKCAMVFVCFLLSVPELRADTFFVDPEESYLSVAIIDHGTSVQVSSAQIDDSDLTTLDGSFNATISGGTITFTTSSNVIFDDQSTDMLPAIGGGSASAGTTGDPYPPSPSSDPANYGFNLTFYNDPGDPGSGIAAAGVAAILEHWPILRAAQLR